ncbi:MAG: hypothetical protein ACXVRR_01530 [Gaiellaceae bacterium]
MPDLLAMVLDFGGVSPNPARDRVRVRLPLEEPAEPETPSADHVEAVGWLLSIPYLIGLLTLDATGVRVGELEAARIGDLDELAVRGSSWAEIGDLVGQRSRLVTADTYTHAMVDYREVNRSELLKRVRVVESQVRTPEALTT